MSWTSIEFLGPNFASVRLAAKDGPFPKVGAEAGSR